MEEFIPVEIWDVYIIPYCSLSMIYVNKLYHNLSLTLFRKELNVVNNTLEFIKGEGFGYDKFLAWLNEQDVHMICKYVSYHNRHSELIELLCKKEKCVHTMLNVSCKKDNFELVNYILKNSRCIQLDITDILLCTIKRGNIQLVKLLTSTTNCNYNATIKPKIHRLFDTIHRKYYISNNGKVNIMFSCILSGVLDVSKISLNSIYWLIKHVNIEIHNLKLEKEQKKRYYGSYSLNDQLIREMKQYLNKIIDLLPVDSDVDYDSSSSEDMEFSDN